MDERRRSESYQKPYAERGSASGATPGRGGRRISEPKDCFQPSFLYNWAMTQKLGVAFANRFHLVANRYARVVNDAYNGDQEAAMRNGDATVAARVREWELAQGIEPRDWLEIGRTEGR